MVIQMTWAVTASVWAWFVLRIRSPSNSSRQQIRGSGSPASRSITRLPPKAVSTSTIPGGSVRTSAISAASSHPGDRAQRPHAASAPSGATMATKRPSFATYIGSIPRSSDAPATSGSPARRSRSRGWPRREARTAR